MVGSYPVHIPLEYKESRIKSNNENDNDTAKEWTLYEIKRGLRVAVFDAVMPNRENDGVGQVGIMLILPSFEPTNSQALINTIANENNDPLTICKTVKFPDDCGSVMHGKRVNFNLTAQLDRYMITGCNHTNFPAHERILYAKEMRDANRPDAKGWSAHSAIQYTPDSLPCCLIEPENTCYHFMQSINQPIPTIEEDEMSSRKMSGPV